MLFKILPKVLIHAVKTYTFTHIFCLTIKNINKNFTVDVICTRKKFPVTRKMD